jgi:hypothetical protein
MKKVLGSIGKSLPMIEGLARGRVPLGVMDGF